MVIISIVIYIIPLAAGLLPAFHKFTCGLGFAKLSLGLPSSIDAVYKLPQPSLSSAGRYTLIQVCSILFGVRPLDLHLIRDVKNPSFRRVGSMSRIPH
jgi:hypothetical protein